MRLDLPTEEIDGLINNAKIYLDKYSDGRYGYCFLHIQEKITQPKSLYK